MCFPRWWLFIATDNSIKTWCLFKIFFHFELKKFWLTKVFGRKWLWRFFKPEPVLYFAWFSWFIHSHNPGSNPSTDTNISFSIGSTINPALKFDICQELSHKKRRQKPGLVAHSLDSLNNAALVQQPAAWSLKFRIGKYSGRRLTSLYFTSQAIQGPLPKIYTDPYFTPEKWLILRHVPEYFWWF